MYTHRLIPEPLSESEHACEAWVVATVDDLPLSQTVLDTTRELVRLANFTYKFLPRITNMYAPNLGSSPQAGPVQISVGNHFHAVLYKLARNSRDHLHKLPHELLIRPPATMKREGLVLRRGEQSTAGPDFVLDGPFDNQDVFAAWDFTTFDSVGAHTVRDVNGIPTYVRKAEPFVTWEWVLKKGKRPKQRQPPKVQEGTYWSNEPGIPWTSYIVICY